MCQWRRSLKWVARLKEALPLMMANYDGVRFIFLTLTVRNCPTEQLKDTLTHLNKSWQRLTQRSVWPGLGFVKALEVTRNHEDDTCHPHIHAVVAVNKSYFTGRTYLSHEKWTQLWRQALRVEYDPIVHVKRVKARRGQVESLEDYQAELKSVESAVVETVKYGTKPSDVMTDNVASDSGWLKAVTVAMDHTRLISVGGIFKEYMPQEDIDNNLTYIKDESSEQMRPDEPDLYFKWNRPVTAYTLVEE